ncbi:hypothetical protein ACQ4PT_011908 [Festuca glaucescens]
MALILVLPTDMPNGIKDGDDIPSDDVNSIAAILWFLCRLILLRVHRASSDVPSEMSVSPTEDGVRQRYLNASLPPTDEISSASPSSSSSGVCHLHTIVQAAFKAQGDAAFERKDCAQASALYTRIEHQQSIIMQNISSETVLDDLPEFVVIYEILLSPGAVSRKLSQQTILWYFNPCPYKGNPVIHGSCDGLLVVSFCDSGIKEYFDVYNPITRKRAPLPLTRGHEDGLTVTGIRIAGFYQHLASEEYRVLYSVCTRNKGFFTSKVDFHVLAVGYNESRPVKELPLQQDFLDRLTCSRNAPVLNHGNLHWLLARYYTSNDFSNIIVFDTEIETFRWMRSPPCQYPWMSLLELDGALAMCSSHDGIVIDIYVMHDYEAKVWALTYKINLSALEPQLHLLARTLRKIATLNEGELLIELPGCVLHCDLDGKFLGKMDFDEHKDNHMHITSFRFQENIVSLPFFGTQEDYGENIMPEDKRDDEMKYSWPEK